MYLYTYIYIHIHTYIQLYRHNPAYPAQSLQSYIKLIQIP